MTRLFDAPRHLVFEAMTKPEHIRRWWGNLGEGYSVPVCEVDLRVGGKWRFVGNRRPKGQTRSSTGLPSRWRLASARRPRSFFWSVASGKYVDVLLPILGERLRYPVPFVGRGDMSRGGLLLRSAASDEELEYEPLAACVCPRGPRPPKLDPATHVHPTPQSPRLLAPASTDAAKSASWVPRGGGKLGA